MNFNRLRSSLSGIHIINLSANACFALVGLLVQLYFFKHLILISGIDRAEYYILTTAVSAMMLLPLTVVPVDVSRRLYSGESLASLKRFFFRYGFLPLGVIFSFGYFYFDTNPVAVFVPLVQIITNCFVPIFDFTNDQPKKLVSALVPGALFFLLLSYNPYVALAFFYLGRVMLLSIFNPLNMANQLGVEIFGFREIIYAASQSAVENASKLMIPVLAGPGAVVIFELICKNIFIARGLIGSAMQPYVFQVFSEGGQALKNKNIVFIHVASIGMYFVFSIFLRDFYDLQTITNMQIMLLVLAFLVSQCLTPIRFAELLVRRAFFQLAGLTLSILIFLAVALFLGFDVITAYSIGIISHSLLVFFLGGKGEKNHRSY